jgi:predicted dehydrogenase
LKNWWTYFTKVKKHMHEAVVKVGVIGLGVGEKHLKAITNCPEAKVQRICDWDKGVLEAVGQRYPGVSCTSDPEEILNDPTIDLVVVASYDDCHATQILAAMEQGKHVFAEKPLCVNENECRQIYKALKERPECRLSSNLILRRSPRFMRLREKAIQGDLGELYYLEADYDYGRLGKLTQGWRGKRGAYSVMLGGGVHVVDLLRWLSGKRVVEVCATANAICSAGTDYDGQDLCVALLRFENDMIAKVSANFGCVTPHFHRVRLYGTKQTFSHDNRVGEYRDSRSWEDDPLVVHDAYPGVEKGVLLMEFIRSLSQGALSPLPIDDLFATMAVCFAIDRAVKSKSWVQVDYLT